MYAWSSNMHYKSLYICDTELGVDGLSLNLASRYLLENRKCWSSISILGNYMSILGKYAQYLASFTRNLYDWDQVYPWIWKSIKLTWEGASSSQHSTSYLALSLSLFSIFCPRSSQLQEAAQLGKENSNLYSMVQKELAILLVGLYSCYDFRSCRDCGILTFCWLSCRLGIWEGPHEFSTTPDCNS